ncbi:MAG: di-trans,poly-cis-decaprenylcistransferase [Planctomycetes bacterium]|nr:di-trans,poly-cis-decaprenylcistransferase [Planctomycetota bacterium]
MKQPVAATSKDPTVVPRSVAVIMDGNGRWAQQAGFERIRGHERGTDAVRTTVTECARLGVQALTLYAFSEENWARPKREVALLMKLLQRFLVQERPTLMDNRVRLLHSGRRQRLDGKTLALLDETIATTAKNDGMLLNLAISYGGRQELVDAVQALARDVQAGRLRPDAIDAAAIAARLYQPTVPDPDLLIRTAGELRVSNFLLWQISYAEIWVTEVCWPEFGKQQLHAAFADFGRRTRKFGKVP